MYSIKLDPRQRRANISFLRRRTSLCGFGPPATECAVHSCHDQPEDVQIEKARIDKYNWIDVCFLEDLLDAGVFAEHHKEGILTKQESDAGHPQATDAVY